MKLILGNSLDKLKELEDNSVDSIVTDPPYELGFMGKGWDKSGIANNVELWKECLRVLKPGGHLLAFSGTRTYHRMAVAIEDAGFEVRDMIEWVYGSGFPKSLNIGKAVDKSEGKRNTNTLLLKNELNKLREQKAYSKKKMNELCGFEASNFFRIDNHLINIFPTGDKWEKIKEILGDSQEIKNKIESFYKEAEREIIGKAITNKTVYQNIGGKNESGEIEITKGSSEWEGWGTALKPAHEPICMARKPLAEKNVANNVLKWGVGGINIDESRVEFGVETDKRVGKKDSQKGASGNPFDSGNNDGLISTYKEGGRFPANLIHDNSEEVRECFPDTKSGGAQKGSVIKSKGGGYGVEALGKVKKITGIPFDSGSASRFFKSILYYPKASKKERNMGCINNHPTVKSVALMEYLIKMVTPKGGIVLDPFMGSGSTGVAAKKNGYDFIGIDMTPEYVEIAKARINAAEIENRLL